MKKLILVATALVLFTGCQDLTGTLTVWNDITLVSTNGKKTTFQRAKYTGTKIQATRKALNIKTRSGQKVKIGLKKFSFPSWGGSFKLKGKQIGQAYDFEGTVHYRELGRQFTREIEHCTYIDFGMERQGTMVKEYYVIEYQRDIDIEILSGSKKMAEFEAFERGSRFEHIGSPFPECR